MVFLGVFLVVVVVAYGGRMSMRVHRRIHQNGRVFGGGSEREQRSVFLAW